MPKSDQGVTRDRYQIIPRTLMFIMKGSQVLLLKGAANKRLWANQYNGIGGHLERGEDVLSAARRELMEEAGISVRELRLVGTIVVDVEPTVGIGIYVFQGVYSGGQVIASEEGSLEWHDIQSVSELPLVEDLRVILPRVVEYKANDVPFSALYQYDDVSGGLEIRFG